MNIVPLNAPTCFEGVDISNKPNSKLPLIYSKCSLVISEAKNKVRILNMKKSSKSSMGNNQASLLVCNSITTDRDKDKDREKENSGTAYKKYTSLNKKITASYRTRTANSSNVINTSELVVQSVKSFIHRGPIMTKTQYCDNGSTIFNDGGDDVVRKKSIAINTTYRRGGKYFEHRVSNKLPVERCATHNPISVYVSVKQPYI
jgi:hypothetical protein